MERALQEAAVLMRHGSVEEAVRRYRAVLKLAPQDADVHYNLGVALARAGRHEEALASLRHSLAIRPGAADAHINIGDSLQALGRHEDAIGSYAKALVLQPGIAEAHNNTGNALQALARHEEAVSAYQKALQVNPDYVVAHNNLGNAQNALGRHDEALECFWRAQQLDPGDADAHYYEAIAHLRAGNLGKGWEKFEWRWRRTDFPSPVRNLRAELWLGKRDLSGKTILLHAEQGLGDAIQFVRYAPLVAARGARVILEVQAPLVHVMSGLAGVSKVIPANAAVPETDFHCPLMSLPLAFGTTLESVPASIPYLSVAPEAAAAWYSKLATNGERLIGIAWTGNPKHEHAHARDLALETLEPLLRTAGIRFVSLKKELDKRERNWLMQFSNVAHPGETFERTAELIGALDLVISVDTAWVHWAGAIGKPVWVLLAAGTQADWRWMAGRSDSPWYPTGRLFRQPGFGDWTSVVACIKRSLDEWMRKS